MNTEGWPAFHSNSCDYGFIFGNYCPDFITTEENWESKHIIHSYSSMFLKFGLEHFITPVIFRTLCMFATVQFSHDNEHMR